MKKKGLSLVVTSLLLIVLVFVAVSIIWVFVSKMITDATEGSESCLGILEKVSINNDYTCYNETSEGMELQFSINIDDIDIDELLISVSSEGSSENFKISNTEARIDNLKNYPDRTELIKLPGKNAGLTYLFNMSSAGLTGQPDLIEIAPIINENQCEVSDSLNEIDDCALFG